MQFASAHRDYNFHFWRHAQWSDGTKMELFGHNDHHYIWRKKGDPCKSENIIPTVKYDNGSIMLWACFAARGD